MIYLLIIKNNVVINKLVGDNIIIDYPFPYDLIIEDVNLNVKIGSIYNPLDGTFSDLGNPYDELDN
jgi:hypothetical protein